MALDLKYLDQSNLSPFRTISSNTYIYIYICMYVYAILLIYCIMLNNNDNH